MHEDTLSWIQQHDAPFAVISCAGRYRTGKSFLLNRLTCSGTGKGFKVGDTVQACTKGIWLYKKWCPGAKADLLFMDTEGISALDADDTHDARIFTLSLLLSSVFLYNSTGALDETTMQTLSLMSKVTASVKMNTAMSDEDDKDNKSPGVAAHMPAFFWVLRDFSLRLVDKQGADMTSDAYLEEALQSGAASKGGVRATIRSFFPKRRLVTLCRPSDDSVHQPGKKQVQVSKRFSAQVDSFQKTLFEEALPFCDRSRPVSGAMFAALCRHLAKVVEGNAVPVMQDSWSLMAEVRARDAQQESEARFRAEVRSLHRMPRQELTCKIDTIRGACIDQFEGCLLADTHPSVMETARKKLAEALAHHAAECEEKLSINVAEEVAREISVMETLLSQGDGTLCSLQEAADEAQARMLSSGGSAAVNEFKSALCSHLWAWSLASETKSKARLSICHHDAESLKRRISVYENDAEAQRKRSDVPDEKDITISSMSETLQLFQTKLADSETEKSCLASELCNADVEYDFLLKTRLATMVQDEDQIEGGLDDDYTTTEAWELEKEAMDADIKRQHSQVERLSSEKDELSRQLHKATILQQQIEERWRAGLDDVKISFEDRLREEREKLSRKEEEANTLKDKNRQIEQELCIAREEALNTRNLNKEEMEQMRKSMLSQKEMCDASQKRVIEIHTTMVEEIRNGEKRARETQLESTRERERLTQRLIETGFEKDRMGDALVTSKKRIIELDTLVRESKQIKVKHESDKMLLIRSDAENETLKKNICETIQERDKLRADAMKMQGTIALLKAENELYMAKKNFDIEG